MSRSERDPVSHAPDERRPITVRLPNETLAELQFVSAAIRRSTGAALGSSAIVRGLISWLAETDVDTRRIRTPEELRARLLSALGDADPGRRSEEIPAFGVSLQGHTASHRKDEGPAPEGNTPSRRRPRDMREVPVRRG